MMSKEEIRELLRNIRKYFKEAPKHLNNMYPIDEKQYRLISEYIEQLETESNILENKLNQLNTYILINGIDDTLKTATQISVENQRYYLHQKEVERLKKIIENSISKSVIENLLHKEMNRRYEASKSDLCNEKELEYRRGRTDILQEIMKGENDE